jgi:hypothetical protein
MADNKWKKRDNRLILIIRKEADFRRKLEIHILGDEFTQNITLIQR